MLMTTGRLIALRLFNVTVGRSEIGNRLLRRMLVYLLIGRRGKKEAYMASSKFFLLKDLD
jgi:hypothetical protein